MAAPVAVFFGDVERCASKAIALPFTAPFTAPSLPLHCPFTAFTAPALPFRRRLLSARPLTSFHCLPQAPVAGADVPAQREGLWAGEGR